MYNQKEHPIISQPVNGRWSADGALIEGLQTLVNKQEDRPRRKHGNVPL